MIKAVDIYYLFDQEGKELLQMDVSYLTPDSLFPPHVHNKLEISLAKSGEGRYRIGEREYGIRPGDVFVINNVEVHNILVERGMLENTVLHFEPEFLWSLFGNDADYRFLNVFFARNDRFRHCLDRDNPATATVRSIILEIEKEMLGQAPYYDLQVKVLMESLLLEMLRGYDYFDRETKHQTITPGEAFVTREVLHHIDINIREKLTLQELAKVARLSPAYFSALFKKYNGVTLFEYITKKRVEHAIALISSTDRSLSEIAEMCGFNSSTNFNKAFRRITGEAPSFFRKNPMLLHGLIANRNLF